MWLMYRLMFAMKLLEFSLMVIGVAVTFTVQASLIAKSIQNFNTY